MYISVWLCLFLFLFFLGKHIYLSIFIWLGSVTVHFYFYIHQLISFLPKKAYVDLHLVYLVPPLQYGEFA